ncbi:MAG: xanthine dehydrogenase family protein subunit M [Anaerolineae bacterium]|nr:xanthine dehydrogenase family protein subunit M [Anaerolineae bacterium]
MKPAPFVYLAPSTLTEALALLHQHGDEAKILAGGQSLIPVMNFRLAQPSHLIDLNLLHGLDFIRAEVDGLHIGAMTRQRTVERSPLVAALAPLVHETMPFIAHSQIRNRGTFGGSIAHADPAAELPAVALALNARLRLQKQGSERWLAAAEFFTGLFATDLSPDEMLTEVLIPPTPPGMVTAFMEFARRHGDYALVGVAAALTFTPDHTCREARLVYLSVGEIPTLAVQASAMLVGEKLTDELIATAAHAAASEEIEPSGDIHATAAYKRHLAQVLTRRVLQKVRERVGD